MNKYLWGDNNTVGTCPNCNAYCDNCGYLHERLYDNGEPSDMVKCLNCGHIFTMRIRDFACKRCGKCCLTVEGLMFDWKEKEWVKIIEYISEKFDGILSIKVEEDIEEYYIDSYEVIEKAKKDLEDPLYDALDAGLCPFVYYDENKKVWSCEIRDIRPMVCREYRCDDDTFHIKNNRINV